MPVRKLFKRHRKTALATLTLALLGSYILAVDGPMYDLFTSSVPTIILANSEHSQSGTPANHQSVVYFNGLQGSGLAHSVALRQTWAHYGNVDIVEYPRNRFDAGTVATTTFRWLIATHVHRATLIGVSMGGLLALDLIDLNRSHGSPLQLRVILEDVPAGAGSLLLPGSQACYVVHVGALANLVTPYVWDLFFQHQPKRTWGAGAIAAQVNADEHVSATWPLSSFTEQVHYIISHPLPAPSQYAFVPMVYIQSTLDKLVRNDSTYWLSVFASHQLVSVAATHSGLVTYPDAYQVGYTQAFGLFPPGPAITGPSPDASAKRPVAQTYLGFFLAVLSLNRANDSP
jgi:pimeloyl-ACP methyl ester carboxylesterase